MLEVDEKLVDENEFVIVPYMPLLKKHFKKPEDSWFFIYPNIALSQINPDPKKQQNAVIIDTL